METLWLIIIGWIGTFIPALIGVIFYRSRYGRLIIQHTIDSQAHQVAMQHAQESITQLQHTIQTNKSEYNTHLESLKQEHKETLQELECKLHEQYTRQQSLIQEALHAKEEQQNALIVQKFSEMSDKILEEKSRQFQEKQNLSLRPLHDEIVRFKTELAQHAKDNQERTIALNTEIAHLHRASLQISEDANNLARAMRGDSKRQGQWGEVILERLLELSGLQNGREYYTQVSVKTEENERLRPDVVIHLPNNRFVVVDSKVSLSAYDRYYNEQDQEVEGINLQAHIESVKNHVKSLSAKQYHNHIEGGKLDFVIMFMPIEGAYNIVLQHNMQLFLDSYNKGIILASPTTLMVILRLIHHIWSNEAKDKNIEKILQECHKLIKKFDGFTESMEKISRALENAQNAYEKANTQLKGRGSMASYIRNLDSYMSQIAPKEFNDMSESLDKKEVVALKEQFITHNDREPA